MSYRQQQKQKHTFTEPRMQDITWREFETKFGTGETIDVENAPEWFLKLFEQYGDEENRIFEEQGIYYYKLKDGSIYKNKKRVKGTGNKWTTERKEQRNEDLKGLEGTTSTSDFQKKRQEYWEQREKTIDERWKETKIWQDRMLQVVTEQTQVLQEFLFKMNTKELEQAKE